MPLKKKHTNQSNSVETNILESPNEPPYNMHKNQLSLAILQYTTHKDQYSLLNSHNQTINWIKQVNLNVK